MECVIPGANIKIIAKAIQALSKIGDEISLIAKKESLHFQSVNMTTTAHCTVEFSETFFSSYELLSTPNTEQEELECKIPVKAALSIFKSHNHNNKPEFCKIDVHYNASKIVFKLKYKHDVMVVRTLYLNDGQIVRVNFNTNSSTNQIEACPQLFLQVLSNFQTSDDDMSMEVTTNKAVVRNYITSDTNVTRGIRSQLTLTIGEFDSFKVEQETCITFSLKPFRAAVQFAEILGLNLFIVFETSGKPAAFVVRNPTFQAHFVVSTLRKDEATQSSLASVRKSCRISNGSKANITVQDQRAIESVNWDDDFEVERNGKEDFQMERNGEEDFEVEQNGKEDFEVELNGKEQNEDEDVVPDSPKSKKLASIFNRCYDRTFHPDVVNLGVVLAADSDSE